MSLANSKPLDAAIAVTRFGLGAKPGELQTASADPRGWLRAQITPAGAEQPNANLPPSPDRVMALVAYRDAVKDVKQEAKFATPPVSAAPMTAGAAMASPAMTGMAPAAPAAATGPARNPDIMALRREQLRPILEVVRDEMFARTVLAATTDAPFRERWTLFWANHFTVSAAKLQSSVLAGPFEREAIRPHVFGRFEDLLVASSTHPGMMVYLDQERSAGPNSPAGRNRHMGLNENLAREIMELHSVGADSGYTQADVTEFARALTGYSVGSERDPPERRGRLLFRPQLHEPGARTVMGRSYAEGGPEQARRVLADLAANPKTADRISKKLAAHFVADDPPPALTARLRDAWMRSHGDLAVVATTLIESPEAWTPAQRKFKTPNEFLVSSYRAAGAAPKIADREVVQPLTAFGQRPFTAPQPNGWSDNVAEWAAPDAVVKRMTWAARFAAVYAPPVGAPADLADGVLGARLTPPVRLAVARAETRPEAFTLLLMSPEFQRR